MAWAVGVLVAMATLPFVVIARDEKRRGNPGIATRMWTWAIIVGWAVCALGLALYVGWSQVVGCTGPLSARGVDHWQPFPFGQRCTYDAPPSHVDRPGWAPTVMLLVAVVGLPVVVRRVHRTGRRDRI